MLSSRGRVKAEAERIVAPALTAHRGGPILERGPQADLIPAAALAALALLRGLPRSPRSTAGVGRRSTRPLRQRRGRLDLCDVTARRQRQQAERTAITGNLDMFELEPLLDAARRVRARARHPDAEHGLAAATSNQFIGHAGGGRRSGARDSVPAGDATGTAGSRASAPIRSCRRCRAARTTRRCRSTRSRCSRSPTSRRSRSKKTRGVAARHARAAGRRTPARATARSIRMVGKFRGHNLYGDLPVKSQRKSADWVIKDDLFAVWVTGKKPKGSGLGARRRPEARHRQVDRGRRPREDAQRRHLRRGAAAVPHHRAVGRPPKPRRRRRRQSGPRCRRWWCSRCRSTAKARSPPTRRFVVQFSKDMDEATFAGRVHAALRRARACPATGRSTRSS